MVVAALSGAYNCLGLGFFGLKDCRIIKAFEMIRLRVCCAAIDYDFSLRKAVQDVRC